MQAKDVTYHNAPPEIRSMADAILADYQSGQPTQFIDPITAAIIIEAIVKTIIAVVQAVRECRKDAREAHAMLRRPTLFTKMRLTRNLRHNLTPSRYSVVPEIVNSTLKVWSGKTAEYVGAVFELIPEASK